MDPDPVLVALVRQRLARSCTAHEHTLLECYLFFVDGELCCGVLGESLIVRVGSDVDAATRATAHVRTVAIRGRDVPGCLLVDPLAFRADADFDMWIAAGVRGAAAAAHLRSGRG